MQFDPDQAHASFLKLSSANGLTVPNDLEVLSESNYETQISILSTLSLDCKYIALVQAIYRQLYIDIASRWISNPTLEQSFYKLSQLPKPRSSGYYAFLAISRSLPVTPEILPLVHLTISSTRIVETFIQNPSKFNEKETLEILIALLRLVNFNYDTFISLIPAQICESLLSHRWPSIRYLSVQLLGLYLKASEKTKLEMISTYIGDQDRILGPFEDIDEIDYLFYPSIEAKRISLERNIVADHSQNDVSTQLKINKNFLSPLVSNLAGILVAQASSQTYDDSKFVPTEGAVGSIKKIATAIHSSKPVLLTGDSGSGKTFYLEETAKYFNHENNLVRIHLGDQSDVKILVGTYSIGTKPGSFEWRPGILTVAVKEGLWVLIEDIDKAPTDVLSVLLPLLEKRELLIPSRGEVIKASSGFQIFGTVRTTTKTNGKPIIPEIIGKRLWEQVDVSSPSFDELKLIIKSRFPMLANFSDQFVDTYETIIGTFSEPKFLAINKSSQTRPITSRDLIKWAHRVDNLLAKRGITDPNQALDSATYDNIFSEAVDCFTGFIPNFEASKYLTTIIGTCLHMSVHRTDLFVQNHIPLFSDTDTNLTIGRAIVDKKALMSKAQLKSKKKQIANFADTNHSLRLLEKIGTAVSMKEPTLLVGETGTGKTTVVQHLAALLNRDITVINVSQQTESSDLLGGYKPIDTKTFAVPLKETFDQLFLATFSSKKNEKFSAMVDKFFIKSHWSNLIKLWKEAVKMASMVFGKSDADQEKPKKKRKTLVARHELEKAWKDFAEEVDKFEIQAKQGDKSFLFAFVEGSLIQAVRRGDWVLLDEVNLASPETLESIADLLTESPSITLSEKGDAESIKAHPDFRLFACMNPATDIGKRDLPTGLRSRFTELYVHSPDTDRGDLLAIIDKYIGHISITDAMVVNDVADLYLTAKKLAESNSIVDGANQKPHFSIRTLSRTLTYAASIAPIYTLRRSLYEGFCMSFSTLLDKKSTELLLPIIEKYTILKLKNAKSVMSQIPPHPTDDHQYIQFKHYWLRKGEFPPEEQPDYIITPYVEKNLMNLTRATAGGRYPILIQGPTSSGKTSMINYLAKKTGHKFVRINNHEHTDLQEYLGSYVSDSTGKLAFQEGVLVQAVRNGYWIVLDELNLAPTDVLEALNRLLDDNRELFIPETQEIVRPHPDFMLFATQNPPGLYGGRKVLSRAFRNRFMELHFDDIPESELEEILTQRCHIAPSYSKKIVEVYRQLSVNRQSTRVFEQKNSFATLRDLFRWAGREAIGYEQLAANGYMLLGERVRKKEERVIVKEVLEKVMRVKLDIDAIYKKLEPTAVIENAPEVVWTKGMKKLAVLVSQALINNEPVILVGETGCGKTTICQVLAHADEKALHIVNAHQNTETGDIIGSQRPVRNRSEILDQLQVKLQGLLDTSGTVEELREIYENTDKSLFDSEVVQEIQDLENRLKILFEWSDGSLIQAMKNGDFFLLDEISLADDSVLERLNSVLEPERTILLAEKGSKNSSVTASDGFQFFATMNPGGDYGKKELSPALRNRFTEIWVPSMEDMDDVLQIITSKLDQDLKQFGPSFIEFAEWFGKIYGAGDASSGIISLRDMLAWVGFANKLFSSIGTELSVLHGAAMVFIDSIGTNSSAALAETPEILKSRKLDCVKKLSKLLHKDLASAYLEKFQVSISDNEVMVGPFSYPRTGKSSDLSFNLQAPTTAANAMRVLRGMQVKKPLLLEGSPGVGKTSLITAIANVTGNKLTRINLSEQTDLIDLFGSDSPAEGEGSNQFVWRDAPFLHAMQEGGWVLLDEMNLASQSVLEGLNACLDHRGETYIPELDRTFKCHPNFTVFAAQNPQYQGGGRKGLPKSFVNRFTVVYIDVLSTDDLKMISKYLYPQISTDTIDKMINFVLELDTEVAIKRSFGYVGSPYEFNLRDTMRWLQLLTSNDPLTSGHNPEEFIDVIAKDRFRTQADREFVEKVYTKHFGPFTKRSEYFQLSQNFVQAGHSSIYRNSSSEPNYNQVLPLQCNIQVLETAITCINNAWPMIIVGPTNSGKTSLIRYLAQVTGSELEEFAMNGDIDSMDLLGGFDQVDMNQKCSVIIQEIVHVCMDAVRSKLTKNSSPRSLLGLLIDAQNISITHESIEKFSIAMEKTIEQCSDYHDELQPLLEKLVVTKNKLSMMTQARFEWFDGTLLKAVETGKWLVLDNANLCNPSVLDRLNSLLEINGSLIVNECSLPNGEPRVVKPHKNFRLFLTMDPRYGELSRAMRNRGTEVFLDSIATRATPFDCQLLQLEQPVAEEPLDSQLSSLSLESASLPSSSFVKASDAYARTFSLLEDCNLFCETMSSFAISLELSLLPRDFVNLVPRWFDNVQKLNYYTESEKARIGAFTSYLSLALSTPLESTLDGFSEGISDELKNINSSQPLNPVINSYLSFKTPTNKNSLKPADVAVILYSIPLLNETKVILEKAEVNVKTKKPSSFNYLERAAAQRLNKPIKNPAKVDVYTVSLSLNEFIANVIYTMMTEPVPDLKESLFSLVILLQISKDLTILCSSSFTDESQFPVYRGILEDWYKKYSEFSIFERQIDGLRQAIDQFGGQLELTTGHSMTLLWNSYHKSVPSSLNAWERYERVLSITEKFDAVSSEMYSSSLDTVRSVQSSIIRTIHSTLSSDSENTELDDLITKLEEGIDTLQRQTSKLEVQRHHYFDKGFNSIGQIIELFALLNPSIKNEAYNVLSGLAYNARYSTLHLSEVENHNLQSPYPPLFDTLWSYDGINFSYGSSDLVNNRLGHLLLTYTSLVDTVASQDRNQALSDFRILSETVVNQSQYLVESHLSQFSQLLYLSILRIIELHSIDIVSVPKSVNDLTTEIVSSLRTNVLSSENTTFANVFEKYISLSLTNLTYGESKLHTARAWVCFALAMLILYVPNIPVDPAIHQHVTYDRSLSQKTFNEEITTCWSYLKSIFISPGNNEVEKVWDERLPQPTVENIPQIYRPPLSQIGLVYDEWHSLLSSIPEELILSLVQDDDVAPKLDQIKNIQRNTSQFITRMNNNYKQYADITSVLHSFVYYLKLGLDIFSSITDEDKFNPYDIIDPVKIVDVQKLTTVFNATKKEITKMSDDISNPLLLCLLSTSNLIQKSEESSENNIALLDEINAYVFRSFYYKWSLTIMKDESEEAAKQTIYKDSSEDDVEEDFKRMFPDYEDVLSIEGATKIKNEDIHYDLVKLYINMFNDSSLPVKTVITKNVNFLKRYAKESPEKFVTAKLTNVLPGLVKILQQAIQGQNANDAEDSPFDFYHSSLPEETTKFTSLALKIKSQIDKYLELWPEHATLQHISANCDDILALPLLSPIGIYLVKTEQIYELLDGWEKSSSKDYSVKNLSADVSAIIVNIRKIELSSHPKLLDLEEINAIKRVSKEWFTLFELVFGNIENIKKDDDEDSEKNETESNIIYSLSSFISKSRYGEIAYKMKLLEAFAKHAEKMGKTVPELVSISEGIKNVLNFYDPLAKKAASHNAEVRKRLLKDIKDIIDLVRWKDTTVLALKESSRRSHYKLHKVIRKYREALNESIETLALSGLDALPEADATNLIDFELPETANYNSISLHLDAAKKLSLWKSRPQRLVDLEQTATSMHKFLLKIGQEHLPTLEEAASDIISNMNKLRDATPKVMTEDTKKDVSSLRMQKAVLLTSTIKELRESGLKTTVRADIKESQALMSSIMGSVPSLSGLGIGKSNVYFYKILDLVPKLRHAAITSASDAPAADLQRGLAISENFLAALLQQRYNTSFVSEANKSLETLVSVITSISSLFRTQDIIQTGDNLPIVKAAQNVTAWVPKLMSFAIESCSTACNVGNRSPADTKVFSEVSERFIDLAVRFRKYKPLIESNIVTSSLDELIAQIKTDLMMVSSEIKAWNQANISLAFIGDIVIQWIGQQLIHLNEDVEVSAANVVPTIEEFDEALTNLCKSTMVVIQNIVAQTKEEITMEAENWFIKSQNRLSSYSRQLHLEKILNSIRDVISMAVSISFSSPEDSSKVISLVGTLVPFVKEYQSLCELIQNKIVRNMNSVNKTGYILMNALYTISTNGFCTPQEESKEKDTENSTEGTGLGDGAGGESNNDNIEQDEGLTEDAQTENKDQNKDDDKDENEEDNAIEMEGDMAGDLEDAPDQEKSDDENDDNDDEENEMDEEVGDVDDLDPNAIDEKMWDEEGDDPNEKEKESDNMPQNKSGDDLQANEDEGDNQDGQENEGENADDEGKDKEDKDNDGEGDEEEEEVAEQEDGVKNDEQGEQLDNDVPDSEVLDLPEDMNLDGDEKDEKEQQDMDDDLEDDIDMDDAEDDGDDMQKNKDIEEDNDGAELSETEGDNNEGDENDKEEDENDVDGMDTGEVDEDAEGEQDDDEEGKEREMIDENDENETADNGQPQEDTQMKEDIEGLDGPDQSNMDDAVDDENAVTQETSADKQGEGDNYETEEEQQNMDNSGGTSASKPENEEEAPKEEEEQTAEEQARKDVEESMKQLGDVAKEYYNRKKEIKEQSDVPEDENETSSANQNPDEFEHMDGESSKNDTQALGAASNDHHQRIDENMEIDEDEKEGQQETEETAAETHDAEDEDMPDAHEDEQAEGEQATDMSQNARSIVGERNKDDDEELGGSHAVEDINDDEDVEMQDLDDPFFDGAEQGFEPSRTIEEARDLWQKTENVVQESSMALTEQLRLILEPTQATKLRGDFKTGKRLNMKRIIPYIASQFKKDKIWMRRTKPSKRQYQIMIAVDDSKSMAESQSSKLAFQSIALIAKALTQLEAGQLAIARFGEDTQVVHPFERPFGSESGAHVLQWFGFQQTRTDVKQLVKKSIGLFENAAASASHTSGSGELWRLQIIISDGMCESHDTLQKLVRKARDERIMMVFVIVDGINNQGSILEMKDVQYDPDTGDMKISRYLDHFPFEYYIIVKEIRELPNVLSLVLRQFFAEVAES